MMPGFGEVVTREELWHIDHAKVLHHVGEYSEGISCN